MSNSSSMEFVYRLVNERFGEFRLALDEFLNELTRDNRNQKISSANKVLDHLTQLKNSMSAKDHPSWIHLVERQLKWYLSEHAKKNDAGLQVIKTMVAQIPIIDAQKWSFLDSSTSTGIDFNKVYRQYYKESRVPELFDELVGYLHEILESGEIDSVRKIKALEDLIATIKLNSRKDFFSTRLAVDFTQQFFKNFTFEVVESDSKTGILVRSIRKTLDDMDLDMAQVSKNIQNDLLQFTKEKLPMLNFHPLKLSQSNTNLIDKVENPDSVDSNES